MKMLIIEDDENILSVLKRGFEEESYVIDTANTGDDGEYLALTNKYDVILLDWMLPNKNGIEILENLRNNSIDTFIIMLTAKDDIDDKVMGLTKGADDYVGKPFSFKELLARVNALYRRSLSATTNIIEVGEISINLDLKLVFKNNDKIIMSQKEYELLLFSIKNKNQLVSNRTIEEQLWTNEEYINSNVIQVTIYNLRKKLGKELIKSTRGLGYRIVF